MLRLPALAAVVATLVAASAHAQTAGPSVAFTQNGTGGVWSVSPSGGTPTRLTSNGTLPAFSPNGAQIATVSGNSLYVGNVGSKLKRLTARTTPQGYLDGGPAAWSPNGRQLAYVSAGAVWVINAKPGSKPKQVWKSTGFLSVPAQAAWSPNGSTIYFIAIDQAMSTETSAFGLYQVPATGGSATQVPLASAGSPQLWGSLTPYSLSMSPSGTTIAVTLGQNGGAAGGYSALAVGLVSLGGAGSTTALPGFSAAAFAPSGQQLCAQDASGNLDVIDLSGNIDATLVSGTSPTACAWIS